MSAPNPPQAAQQYAIRRAHLRYDIRLAAELTLPGGRIATATTKDLSQGGACLESAYAVEDGADLAIALFVVVDDVEEASLPPLRLRASVQWTAQNEEAPVDARHIAGVKFAELTAAQAAWLKRFLPRE